jgi:hypothetical protein
MRSRRNHARDASEGKAEMSELFDRRPWWAFWRPRLTLKPGVTTADIQRECNRQMRIVADNMAKAYPPASTS